MLCNEATMLLPYSLTVTIPGDLHRCGMAIQHFDIQGGRGGRICFEHAGRKGYLAWEGLIGEVHMVIYLEDAMWTEPDVQEFSPDERAMILASFSTWAEAEGIRFELFPTA